MRKFTQKAVGSNQHQSRLSHRAKVNLSIAALIVYTLVAVFITTVVQNYINSMDFKFQSPVSFHMPLTITPKKELISPLPKDKEASPSAKKKTSFVEQAYAEDTVWADTTTEDEFIDDVWYLETNRGQNTNPGALHNICKAKNESNEYGMGGMQLMICYPSHEYATARVRNWYRAHSELTEAQKYCVYNTGRAVENCEYYKNALAI